MASQKCCLTAPHLKLSDLSLKKLLFVLALLALGLGLAGMTVQWSRAPILPLDATQPVKEFTIKPGSGVRSTAQQIEAAGIPLSPILFELFVRATGQASKLKAGDYELATGTTPAELIGHLVRGVFVQKSLVIIEGWTFLQMRAAIAAHPSLTHDTAGLSDQQLLIKISANYSVAEGLFFPDTYLFASGTSELQIFRRAHALMLKRLADKWDKRDPSVPYKTPYEALIMASIVEKETGQKSERGLIAGVFVNRLRRGMMLQTDPTVIYGMGDLYQGKIHKRDLLTDTAYNTYTRTGLPPSPIALPGAAAIEAALQPMQTDALFFVSRGDGTSHFSSNLGEHNRAVNKFQR